MRFLTIILSILLLTSVSIAQPRNGLKGPAAKNYKPWKNESTSNVLVATTTKESLMGPQAKNYKPWKNKSTSNKMVVTKAPKRLMGPAAKNHKPWKKTE